MKLIIQEENFIFWFFLLLLSPVVIGKPQHSLLFNHLMKDYDRFSRPVEKSDDKVEVKIGLALLQIVNVEEKFHTITLNVWLRLTWHDAHFKWNPKEFGNVSILHIPINQVWTPDIHLYNNANNQASFSNDRSGLNAIAWPNGSVLAVPGLTFKCTCPMDVTMFPFDEQTCIIVLGSWTYSGAQLHLELLPNATDLQDFIENQEWDVLELSAKVEGKTYECCPGEVYYSAKFTLKMRRRRLYYFFNLVVPSALIGFLAVLGFTLPPESGEKMTLGVTILFSIIAFLNIITTSMPANSNRIPLLGTYFNCVMVMIAMSVVSPIVINLNKRITSLKPIQSPFLRLLLFRWMPWILRVESPLGQNASKRSATVGFESDIAIQELLKEGKKRESSAIGKENGQPEMGISDAEIIIEWKFVALLVDRFCFFVSILVTIIAGIILACY